MRSAISDLTSEISELVSVFSLFVVWFLWSLIVVAGWWLFAFGGDDHRIWRLWRTIIPLLGKRTRRHEAPYYHRQ
jgi:hypothetical protein